MSDVTTGTYRIVSVLDGEPATSVNSSLLIRTQIVRLRLPNDIWGVIQQAGFQVYQFGIKNRYQFSGRYPDNSVVATELVQDDLKWRVNYRESQSAYTIALDTDLDNVWTVSSEVEPDSQIVIDNIKYLPPAIDPPLVSPTQLFKFIRISDE